MKRSKRIYILLGVLSVSCMATLGVMRWEEEKEKIENSDEIILELSGDQVTSISWEIESEKLAFHKDERWIYDEDEAFPVDEEKISELLMQFQGFGVSFVIEVRMAWKIRRVPYAWIQGNNPMKSFWGATAVWTHSGMFP